MFRQVLEVGIQAELCILLVPHHAHLLVFSNLRQRTRYLLLCPSHRLQEGVQWNLFLKEVGLPLQADRLHEVKGVFHLELLQ